MQYIKDSIREKIQNWLISKFIEKTKLSKMTASTILYLVAVDIKYIIKYILTRYGLRYLFKYVVFLAMI
jgi:hypothetical protein